MNRVDFLAIDEFFEGESNERHVAGYCFEVEVGERSGGDGGGEVVSVDCESDVLVELFAEDGVVAGVGRPEGSEGYFLVE